MCRTPGRTERGRWTRGGREKGRGGHTHRKHRSPTIPPQMLAWVANQRLQPAVVTASHPGGECLHSQSSFLINLSLLQVLITRHLESVCFPSPARRPTIAETRRSNPASSMRPPLLCSGLFISAFVVTSRHQQAPSWDPLGATSVIYVHKLTLRCVLNYTT